MTGEPFPKTRRRRQRPPGRRLGPAPRDLRGRRGAVRASGRRSLGVEQKFRGMTPAGRRHRCPGELHEGGDLQRTKTRRSRSSPSVPSESLEGRAEGTKDEDDQSRQLVLFRDDSTTDSRDVDRADPNDPRARDAAELLPLSRRTNLRPCPRLPAPRSAGREDDRAVWRRQRGRQDDAARRDSACSLRAAGTLLQAGRAGVRRVPPQVDPPRRRRERGSGRLARVSLCVRR